VTGGGFVAVGAGAAAGAGLIVASDDGLEGCEASAPVGTTRSSRYRGAECVTGAASERHRPSRQEEIASVTTNAPTARPHNTIGLSTSASQKKRER
jgi:hypothetical protein